MNNTTFISRTNSIVELEVAATADAIIELEVATSAVVRSSSTVEKNRPKNSGQVAGSAARSTWTVPSRFRACGDRGGIETYCKFHVYGCRCVAPLMPEPSSAMVAMASGWHVATGNSCALEHSETRVASAGKWCFFALPWSVTWRSLLLSPLWLAPTQEDYITTCTGLGGSDYCRPPAPAWNHAAALFSATFCHFDVGQLEPDVVSGDWLREPAIVPSVLP
jgi:hypothetical protein